ncbi:MAG: DUF819 family protein [Bacteroidales bacterium]
MTYLIILSIIFYIFFPAVIIKLCEKVKLFKSIGPILTIYIVGILLSNLAIFPFEAFSSKLFSVQDIISSATIPLAMPLILFSCDFKHLPLRSAVLSLIFGIVAMIAAITSGYFLFQPLAGIENFKNISGLLVGVYTGGTPNLAALKMMLGVSETNYLIINSFDMIVSFIYLIFLMSIGIKLFRWILPYKSKRIAQKLYSFPESKTKLGESNEIYEKDSDYHNIFTRQHFPKTLKAFGLSLLIVIISVGLSFLIKGKINMIIIMLSLTTLAIAASFSESVRKAEKSYDAGMYLVLIFSLVISTMVNIREINFSEGIWFLLYITYAIFGSLIIQLILSKIFKINSDTTIITSVALINSPLFVPMIADKMHNKNAVVIGISIGIIGYAIGNYLGVGLAAIL